MRKAVIAVAAFLILAVLGNELISVVVLSMTLLPAAGWLFKELADHDFY